MATYVHVGKYSFEIEDLLAYTFVCNTKEAITCVKNKTCCCNIFIIDTTQAKISRIISIFDTIAEFCPNIKNDNEYDNPFEREQASEYFIDKKRDEYCVFSYFDKNKALKCGIHSAALTINKDPFYFKPLTCSIWPLALHNTKGKVEISLDIETKTTCLKKKKKPDNKIDPHFLDIIKRLLGKRMEIFNVKLRLSACYRRITSSVM